MPPPPRSPTSSKPGGGNGGAGGRSSGASIRINETPQRINAAAYSSSLNICPLRRCASSSARSRAASALSLDFSNVATLSVSDFVHASSAATLRSDVFSARAKSHPIHDATTVNAAPSSSAGMGGKSSSCMRPV